MLVYRRVTPNTKFTGTHLYTWVERGTVRVKCLAQEHNTMSPARTQIRTARSGDERTSREATAPPKVLLFNCRIKLYQAKKVCKCIVYNKPAVQTCCRWLFYRPWNHKMKSQINASFEQLFDFYFLGNRFLLTRDNKEVIDRKSVV